MKAGVSTSAPEALSLHGQSGNWAVPSLSSTGNAAGLDFTDFRSGRIDSILHCTVHADRENAYTENREAVPTDSLLYH